jgi:hypothetical protein
MNKILLIFIFGLCSIMSAFCQNGTNNLHSKQDTTRDDGKVFYFRYINTYPYYRNEAHLKSLLEDIRKFEKKEITERKDLQKLYDDLYVYTMNFGTQNFSRESYLLWMLGKLAQTLGYQQRAVQLYSLVLKHYRGTEDTKKRLFYDSLISGERDNYLPVEYYYTYANAASNVDTLEIPDNVYTAMGDSVNSKYDDYAPALSGNDLIMVFTSKRNQRRVGMKYVINEDLYFSRKADSLYLSQDTSGTRIDTIPWTEAKPFKGGINSEYNEGSACVAKNGKTIYFGRCGSPDGFGNCDLYVSFRQPNGKWSEAYNLDLNINSIAWESHPALSHTEDTLFFASDRIGGFGMSDIYYSYRTGQYKLVGENSDTLWTWAPAQNMGPVINTRANELSPFYHPKYDVLYFSSSGQLVNFGKADIYKSAKHKLDWMEPKNLGPLVNYKTDEYYFTIDSRSRNLYYAKAVKIKDFDYVIGDSVTREVLNLHTALLPMEAQPEATVAFEGVVKDSLTGDAFEGIISIIDLDEGIEVAPKYLNKDGSYRFDLIKEHNYLVIITGDDFFRIEREFLLKGDTTVTFEAPSIKFKKWKFEAIEFEESSSLVTEKMKPDLNKLVMFLADHPNLGISIAGHTDSRGNAEGNLRLSKSRAEAIREYMISKGRFDPVRISAEGFGNSQPIIKDEQTDEDRKINRRVEFEIIKLN